MRILYDLGLFPIRMDFTNYFCLKNFLAGTQYRYIQNGLIKLFIHIQIQFIYLFNNKDMCIYNIQYNTIYTTTKIIQTIDNTDRMNMMCHMWDVKI